ncbi:hypothetical protein Fcan01_01475 [Folsomia candida]|uniref:CRAL-TRIO domain-containing protein n=2 Tax=Folsomia candida TaxID=158441 RepID=A0A226F6T1_FOLCA|nr:hypothetical protein Fcan01_01475 [Folsomia candida]
MAVIAVLHTLDNLNMVDQVEITGQFQMNSEKQLQARVSKIMWNEHAKGHSTMHRWLLFKKMNVNNAEKAIRDHIRWRKEFDIDRLRSAPPNPKLWKRFQYNVTVHARNGDPVLLMPFGDWDVRDYITAKGDQHTFDKYQGQMWEKGLSRFCLVLVPRCPYYARNPGLAAVEKVEMNLNDTKRSTSVRLYLVCDLENLEYRQLASYTSLQYIFSMVYNFENNYPETVHAAIMINCDWVFESLLRYISPFLREGSFERLKIYPKDRSKWMKDVRRLIHPSQLPYRYGGYSKSEKRKLATRRPFFVRQLGLK